MTVLAGASGRNLAFAPALLDGSARSHGVTVIAGHRDTHFRPLAALDVVHSTRGELRLDADENIVVLVTCWPFDAVDAGGRWRYVVRARQRF